MPVYLCANVYHNLRFDVLQSGVKMRWLERLAIVQLLTLPAYHAQNCLKTR